jgi:hypothetical protein
MMKSGTASRIVLVSGLGVFAIGWFKSAKENKPIPSPHFLIGATVTFLGLSFLADFEPEIAGPLALAILTTDMFTNGADLLKFINDTGGVTTEQPKAKANRAAVKKVAKPKADVGQVPGL